MDIDNLQKRVQILESRISAMEDKIKEPVIIPVKVFKAYNEGYIKKIILTVCMSTDTFSGATDEQIVHLIKQHDRRKSVVIPRHMICWLIKHFIGDKITLKEIGEELASENCRRDHTTIINSIRKVNELLATDKKFRTITFPEILRRVEQVLDIQKEETNEQIC